MQKEPKASLIIHSAAELITCSSPSDQGAKGGHAQGEIGEISNGAVAVLDDHILAAGPSEEILPHYRGEKTELVDASGKTVTPGLVDAHTHLVWAGWRDEEYEMRLRGASYLEIMSAGGGIMSTVEATRLAGEEELSTLAHGRLMRMLSHGTTTVEVKSGYGLTVEDELKMLRTVRDLNLELQKSGTGPRLVPTFLGAHAIPAEYKDDPNAYVTLVIDTMLPAVVAEGLAEWCDVFCDRGAFTAEQTRRIFKAAKELGLGVRIHANEFEQIGAISVAAEMGAVSADHLLVLNDEEINMLRNAGTIAVLLPGTPLGLGLKNYAPARTLIEAGIPVALGSDCNPGTCPTENYPLILSLACSQMRMSPAEALVAATVNAAHALNRGHLVGSLEPGKLADIVVWDAPNHRHLAYRFGINLAESVFVGGRRTDRRRHESQGWHHDPLPVDDEEDLEEGSD